MPSPESTRACVPEETEAVGVPELTLSTANLAEVVAVPPRRKSNVEVSFGVITPFTTSQLLPAPAAQDPHAALAPPSRH